MTTLQLEKMETLKAELLFTRNYEEQVDSVQAEIAGSGWKWFLPNLKT